MTPPIELPFPDRVAAGRALAAALLERRTACDLVLGLPRGGVVIAAEIARALAAPLDVLLVRKIGDPEQPELALGALAETGHIELNRAVLDASGVDQATLTAIVATERREIKRRLAVYRGDQPPPDVRGRRVVVADDGVATGATVLVALRALRAQAPARLILAIPVCPRPTLRRLAAEADEVVVLATPEPFGSVGTWYAQFRQLTDDEVVERLRKHE